MSVVAALRPSEVARGGPSVGGVLVFSGSELIADGIVGLLPRDWRERIAIVSDLSELRRRLDGHRVAVIVDAGGEDAAAAIRLTAVHGGSTILLVSRDQAELDADVFELADAIVDRDDAEPLRTARIHAGRGCRRR